MPDDNRTKPRPAYSTPTKSAAKVLEELVAQQESPNYSNFSLSSSQLPHSQASRSAAKAACDELPPLPKLPTHLPDSPDTFQHNTAAQQHQEDSSSGSMHNSASSQDSFSETTPTNHKPKHASKSLPRRVIDKETGHRHRHSTPSSEATPTDSHTGHHRYSGSRSRSSSDSISVILLMSKERLARETARANEAERRALDAERQAADVMSLFKNTHEAKLVLERDLNKAREELGLYKVQLDAAQKEIFRAQEIVDRVERQRVKAEEELSRTKEKLRRLSQTLAVEHALEEGRRAGFEEGLKQGRTYQQSWVDIYEKSSRQKSARAESDSGSEISSYTYPKEGSPSNSPGSPRSRGGSSERRVRRMRDSKPLPVPAPSAAAPRAPESVATLSVYPVVSTYNPLPRRESAYPTPPVQPQINPPDVAKYAQVLPIRTVVTPLPVRVPSTQPPIPAPMPPHYAPESIKIHPSDGPLHPIPVYNSPSVFHESVVLPPDGYIPVMDANSVILLPPPHELNQIVAAEEPPTNPPTSKEEQTDIPDPASKSKLAESRFRVINGDRSSKNRDAHDGNNNVYAPRPVHDAAQYGRPTTKQSTVLPPPRSYEAPRTHSRGGHGPDPPVLSITIPRPRPRASTNPDADANGDHWPISPNAHQPRDPGRTQTSGRDSRAQIERPRTADPPVYSRPASSAGVHPSARPARRTREVVLTVPLGDPFDDPTTAHGHSSHPPRTATPANLAYGRPKLGSSDTSSSNDCRGSTATIPVIDVQTPTTTHQSVPSNRTTVVDPVLLTPESACRFVALPAQRAENNGLGIFTSDPGCERLADDNLPSGFVPLSPIPGMENLSPYPPGFAPTIPQNHPSSGSCNFAYSSPLVRPVA